MAARIAPTVPPYPPGTADLLARMTPSGRAPLALFTTFARNPAPAGAVHRLGSYQLSRALSLTLREREIVIDRTCVRCGCAYEWGVHVAHFGERAGLTPAQNRSLLEGTSADPCWTGERERALLDIVDSLCRTRDLDDALWSAAAAVLEVPQLLDAVVLCGRYHAVCFTARAARLRPEPFSARFAEFATGGGSL